MNKDSKLDKEEKVKLLSNYRQEKFDFFDFIKKIKGYLADHNKPTE